jgi:D-psicose/D-tagatose/L-ribulose 3-epimerase
MKYGIHISLWDNLDIDLINIIHRAKKIGFSGVEIPAGRLFREDIGKVKQTLIDNDLGIIVGVGLDSSSDVSNNDEGTRLRGIKILKKSIVIADKLGSDLVTGSTFAGMSVLPKEGRTEPLWSNSVNSIKEVSKFAQEYNIKVGVEAINRFRNYLINTVDEAISFIEDVGEPNLVIHCDTFHMNMEEKNFYDPIKKAGRMLGYIHTNENDRGLLGTGHVDWHGLFRALSEINYDGWLTIETFPPYIRGLSEYVGAWRWVFPSSDELANEGLKFLKKMVVSHSKG